MNMRSLTLMSVLMFFFTSPWAGQRPTETVVLLHGILNRPFVMMKIEKGLEKEGFRVLNWGYKSTDRTVEEYAADLKDFIDANHVEGTIHFVGFSLGSIITRYYLTTSPPANLGRFVQIAPPNHGSSKVNDLSQMEVFQWLYGDKAIQQLRAGSPFLIKLGAPSCEFGIIVGGRGDDKGYSDALAGDDDGSVSLESARLNGAKDFAQVKAQHTLLLAHNATTDYVVSFLKSGRFLKEPKGERP